MRKSTRWIFQGHIFCFASANQIGLFCHQNRRSIAFWFLLFFDQKILGNLHSLPLFCQAKNVTFSAFSTFTWNQNIQTSSRLGPYVHTYTYSATSVNLLLRCLANLHSHTTEIYRTVKIIWFPRVTILWRLIILILK